MPDACAQDKSDDDRLVFEMAANTPPDVAALASLYAEAFSGSPAYASVFQLHGEGERAAMVWLFTGRVRASLSLGNPFLLCRDAGSRQVVAAGGLIMAHARPGKLALLRHGLAAWPFAWGWRSLWRALDVEGQLSRGTAELAGGVEVSMLAVDSSIQGKGIGSKLLTQLLDVERKGVRGPTPGIWLMTQEAKNVRFYEKHGFVVVGSALVATGGTGQPFTSWTMALRR
jgi:GNAT superfamily N-acetyltransferase